MRSGGDWEGSVAGAPGAKAAASVRSVGLKASAPGPAGRWARPAGGGGSCSAGSASSGPEGGRRRCLCRGDGPDVYNQCRSSSRTPSSPVWPRCVATKPSGLLVSITLASRSCLSPFLASLPGVCALPFALSSCKAGARRGKLGAGGEEGRCLHLLEPG